MYLHAQYVPVEYSVRAIGSLVAGGVLGVYESPRRGKAKSALPADEGVAAAAALRSAPALRADSSTQTPAGGAVNEHRSNSDQARAEEQCRQRREVQCGERAAGDCKHSRQGERGVADHTEQLSGR